MNSGEPVQASSFTVSGVEWSVTLQDETFTAAAPGFPEISGRSYEELRNQAKVRISRTRTRVHVPYARMPKGTFEMIHGTATGIHAGNSNVLVTEHGKQEQMRGSAYEAFTPMTPADQARYLQASREVAGLESELRALRSRYAFSRGSLREQVLHEIQQARTTGKAGNEDHL